MALVIFLCRALPFALFRQEPGEGGDEKRRSARRAFGAFVEEAVPQAAMTVLACNAIAAPLRESFSGGAPAGAALSLFAAAAFTALVHLWKRNPLLSIFGGTALYMTLSRLMG
jgi:branched-subunit amino acid transport protein AzlD